MNSQYNNFIGMYQDVYPEGYCEHMINEFENKLIAGHCSNRKTYEGAPKFLKDDQFYFLNIRPHLSDNFGCRDNLEVFFSGLQECFDDYVSEYDVLNGSNIHCSEAKIQKTNPGAGYHVWHYEASSQETSSRILTYILYLNTLESDCAGETELLYQRMRIPPRKNSLIIFPAAYTHTHRGNVVFGDKAKYIITGWFHLA
jgi:hypothetical protein